MKVEHLDIAKKFRQSFFYMLLFYAVAVFHIIALLLGADASYLISLTLSIQILIVFGYVRLYPFIYVSMYDTLKTFFVPVITELIVLIAGKPESLAHFFIGLVAIIVGFIIHKIVHKGIWGELVIKDFTEYELKKFQEYKRKELVGFNLALTIYYLAILFKFGGYAIHNVFIYCALIVILAVDYVRYGYYKRGIFKYRFYNIFECVCTVISFAIMTYSNLVVFNDYQILFAFIFLLPTNIISLYLLFKLIKN
ncbi:MAG: hypothetical protein RR454_00085 [Clostridia bacterium]